ncbi:MAG: S8 family peptidase [Patescibacteria group bacterium]|nr:S8 family peptidase [Patescibacteria group bacterium]
MKKLLLLLALAFVLSLATSVAIADSGQGESDRVYVMSGSQSLKTLLGKKHDFGKFFSTKNSARVKAMEVLGLIETSPVQLVQALVPRDKCGDGYCQGNESPLTCPADCSATPVCSPDNEFPWGIDKIQGGSGGDGILVAVLDTGIDTNHPDLINNLKHCVGSGYPTCEDGAGHGTHVSGTILANGQIKGVAPNADLMAIKVLDDDGGGWASDVAAGIIYAAENGANIISMSLGATGGDDGLKYAVNQAVLSGALVVAATGNDSAGSIYYPSVYAEVVAVGAIDINEAVAYFSNQGINDGDDAVISFGEIELAAPGVSVESTLNNGCYTYNSGTSMATPHVSGLAAKLWQGSAELTRAYLISIAKDINEPGYDIATGYGLPIAPLESIIPECSINTDCDDLNTCTDNICTDGVCEYIDNGSCTSSEPYCGDGTCNRPDERRKTCPEDCA